MEYIKRIIPLAVLIILLALTAYRYYYGTWNPFTAPDRLNVYGRRYYISHNPPETLIGNLKISHLIVSANLITGKMLYTSQPKGEFVPTVIYLRVGSDEYQAYALSGGP